MPADKMINFKPQAADPVRPPILEKILEQYKYFRGIEINSGNYSGTCFYTDFNTNGELVSLLNTDKTLTIADGRIISNRILHPCRTADGFIFSFFEEENNPPRRVLKMIPFYSSFTGRIIRAYWLADESKLSEFNKNKILYASSAEVINRYLDE